MADFNNVEQWREQYYKKLLTCRNEIMPDFAISQAYNSRTFKAYMEQLIGTYGKDCVPLLLYNTVRSSDWDGRYDCDVKAWAMSYIEIARSPINSKKC